MVPEMDVSVLISTNGTSSFKKAELKDIYHKISQASQFVGNWITNTSDFSSTVKLLTDFGNNVPTSHNQIS